MSNPWVEHVRKFAKENGITYMCAISEASKTYKKSKDEPTRKKSETIKQITKETPEQDKRYNLPPLISKREKELNEMKKAELIALLPAKMKNLKKNN